MTRTELTLIATAGSVALLGGAFLFQWWGYPPCELCLWQRWPHAAAIVIGVLALASASRSLALAGALAAAATAVIGVYHTGVERDWWEGPTACSAGAIGDISAGDLLDQIMAAPLVRCDDVVWSLAGLSMASWNAILSLGLAAAWLMAWRARA